MLKVNRITVAPVEVELLWEAFDALEEALPVATRYTDPNDERDNLLLWVPGMMLKVVSVG